MIFDLANRTRVACGLAALQNVLTGSHTDRMHSFVLSETLKYAYLLFDTDNPANHDGSNTVYTTEGHLLPGYRPAPRVGPARKSISEPQCMIYDPLHNGKHWTPLALGIQHRVDADYARTLAGLELNSTAAIERGIWSPYGRCEVHASEVRTF